MAVLCRQTLSKIKVKGGRGKWSDKRADSFAKLVLCKTRLLAKHSTMHLYDSLFRKQVTFKYTLDA